MASWWDNIQIKTGKGGCGDVTVGPTLGTPFRFLVSIISLPTRKAWPLKSNPEAAGWSYRTSCHPGPSACFPHRRRRRRFLR